MSKAVLLLVLATVLLADDDARPLLMAVEQRNSFTSQEHEATVQYYPRGGAPVEKRWKLRSSGPAASRKVLIRFTYPAEVRGVALLILNQPGGAIQWLWTPAIGRDRKIAPQDRGASVLGTDLTFEDLEERSLAHLDVRSEGETTLDGVVCERLLTTPQDPRTSSYSSSLLWVDKKRCIILRAENRRGTKTVRVLEFSDFREVQGVQTPHTLQATAPQTGSRTLMKIIGVRYNAPFRDSDFTREALRSAQ